MESFPVSFAGGVAAKFINGWASTSSDSYSGLVFMMVVHKKKKKAPKRKKKRRRRGSVRKRMYGFAGGCNGLVVRRCIEIGFSTNHNLTFEN